MAKTWAVDGLKRDRSQCHGNDKHRMQQVCVDRCVVHDPRASQTRLQCVPETFRWSGSCMGCWLSSRAIIESKQRPPWTRASWQAVGLSLAFLSRQRCLDWAWTSWDLGMDQLGLGPKQVSPARGCIKISSRGFPDGSTGSWSRPLGGLSGLSNPSRSSLGNISRGRRRAPAPLGLGYPGPFPRPRRLMLEPLVWGCGVQLADLPEHGVEGPKQKSSSSPVSISNNPRRPPGPAKSVAGSSLAFNHRLTDRLSSTLPPSLYKRSNIGSTALRTTE